MSPDCNLALQLRERTGLFWMPEGDRILISWTDASRPYTQRLAAASAGTYSEVTL